MQKFVHGLAGEKGKMYCNFTKVLLQLEFRHVTNEMQVCPVTGQQSKTMHNRKQNQQENSLIRIFNNLNRYVFSTDMYFLLGIF